ncbi:MAG: helix-turn-helix domain-containing protein [Tumebacillaceae bacterium]
MDMSFGVRVKKVRADKKLTLQELSKRSGVSRSMLSKIEREEKNPTIQIAAQVAEGLGMTLTQLLEEQQKCEATLIKKGQRMIFRDEHSGLERVLLSPSFPSTGVELILNILPPGKTSGKMPPQLNGVKKYVTVAKGKLQVFLGERSFMLDEGDSLSFDATQMHHYQNIGQHPCHYYVVIDSHQAAN